MPMTVNGVVITGEDGYREVKAMDSINFNCDRCYVPHLFYVLLADEGEKVF